MVDVEVRADDNIDVLGHHAGVAQMAKKIARQIAKDRNRRPLLVVASASVVEDAQARRLNQPALQEAIDMAITDIVGLELGAVRVEHGRVEAVEQKFGRCKFALPFLDPLDLDRSDAEPVHDILLA